MSCPTPILCEYSSPESYFLHQPDNMVITVPELEPLAGTDESHWSSDSIKKQVNHWQPTLESHSPLTDARNSHTLVQDGKALTLARVPSHDRSVQDEAHCSSRGERHLPPSPTSINLSSVSVLSKNSPIRNISSGSSMESTADSLHRSDDDGVYPKGLDHSSDPLNDFCSDAGAEKRLPPHAWLLQPPANVACDDMYPQSLLNSSHAGLIKHTAAHPDPQQQCVEPNRAHKDFRTPVLSLPQQPPALHLTYQTPPGPWRNTPHGHWPSRRSLRPPRPSHISFRQDVVRDHPLYFISKRPISPTLPSLLPFALASSPSMLLAIPCSPGHQIQPPVEPGSFLGVRRPLLTQRYAVYDVPFYGIESGDNENDNGGSSSRYDVAIVSHIPTDEERVEHGLEVTSEHVVSLSKHREHIWSIAHEHEYGAQTHGIEKVDCSSGSSIISGGGKSNGQDLNQGRHKRLRRWIPVQPRVVAYSGSGSGCGCSSLYGGSGSRSGHCLRGQSSCSSTSGMCNRAVARATGVTGHTVGITIETAQNSRTQKQLKSASQGKYGPDSFLESLENSKRVNPPPPRGWSRYKVIVRKQWKNWWCLLVTVAVVVVVAVVILLKKPAQANNRSVAVASDDAVEDEQDDNPR